MAQFPSQTGSGSLFGEGDVQESLDLVPLASTALGGSGITRCDACLPIFFSNTDTKTEILTHTQVRSHALESFSPRVISPPFSSCPLVSPLHSPLLLANTFKIINYSISDCFGPPTLKENFHEIESFEKGFFPLKTQVPEVNSTPQSSFSSDKKHPPLMGNLGCGPASDQGVCREDHPENETPMLPLRDSAKNFIYPTNLPQCGKPKERVGPGAWSQRCFRSKDDMGGGLISSNFSSDPGSQRCLGEKDGMGGGQNIQVENELITGQETNFAQSQNYLNENIEQVGLNEINYVQNEPVSRPPTPRRTSCGEFQNNCLKKNKRGTEFLPVAPAPYPPSLSPKVPGAAQHTSTRCSAACSSETTATNIYSKTHIFLKNINMIKIQRNIPKEVHHSNIFCKRSKPRVIFRKERTDLLFDLAPPFRKVSMSRNVLNLKCSMTNIFFVRQL